MKLIEFFKPNKWKIINFVVLCAVGFVNLVFMARCGSEGGVFCPNIAPIFFLPGGLYFDVLWVLGQTLPFFVAAYFYILSCIFYWIDSKIKARIKIPSVLIFGLIFLAIYFLTYVL